ncbi:MAG: preprotein translocase subunit YajC [Gammaproteobacteria bacterium]
MNWLIDSAWAADAGGLTGGLVGPLLFPIVLIAIFYFLIIRPQMKRQKEHRTLISGLKSGDEVVTSGGVLGQITTVGDQFVTLEIAPGTSVKVQKHAVSGLVPKGTVKNS